jgi:hypothetical protein
MIIPASSHDWLVPLSVVIVGIAGFLLPLLSSLAGAFGAAGKASSAAAGGREREAILNQNRDSLRSQQWAQAQQARLLAAQESAAQDQWRAKFGITAPSARAQQTAVGDMLANLRNATVSGLPPQVPRISISGGMQPDAVLGPNARAAGSALSRQALQALLSGSDMPAATDFAGTLQAPPGLTSLPQASGWAKAGNILGILGGMTGAAIQPYLENVGAAANGGAGNPAASGINIFGQDPWRNIRFGQQPR